jgi:MFS family permease
MSLSSAALRLPDFRKLLFMRVLAMAALQAQDVIIGWQIYTLRHDAFLLGLTGLAEAVPALACALVAGHVVDTHRPWRVLLVCEALLALNMGVLLCVGGGYAGVTADHVIPCLFIGIFCSGLLRSFIMPSSFTLLPQIVSREEISSASAWFTGGFQFAAIGSPAIAGLIYGYGGARLAWWLPASAMLLSVLCLTGLGPRIRIYHSEHRREKITRSIAQGWRYILDHPLLLSVMALDMFAVLFGGAVAMLPAYADTVLHTGSQGLGLLRSAPAIGAVLMTILLGLRPLDPIRGATLLKAVAGFGCCIIGFGLSASFAFSFFCLLMSGVFDSVSMVIRGALMQLQTPDAMRGRVSSVNSMFIISSNEIGAFESGLAARLFGLTPSVVLGGVASLLVVAGAAFFAPVLRKAVVDPRQLPQ